MSKKFKRKFKRKLKKFFIFVKKEERKAVSMLFVFLKILSTLLIVLCIPAIYFLISINIRPRVFPKINEFVEKQISERIEDTQLDVKESELGFNSRLNFTYNVKNVAVNLSKDRKNQLFFPSATIEVDLLSLLIGKVKVDNITVSNSKLYVNKITSDTEKIGDFNEGLVDIYKSIRTLTKKQFPIRRVVLRNSELIFSEGDTERKIKILESDVRLDFKINFMEIKVENLLDFGRNKNKTSVNTTCFIFKNKKILCNLDFFNIDTAVVSDVFPDYPILKEYGKNIKTSLSGRTAFLFENYVNLKVGKFEIFAKKGSFDMRKFFSQRMDFDGMTIKGNLKDNFKNFSIKEVKTRFGGTDFLMSMNVEQTENFVNTNLRFDLKNIDMSELDKLWPVFLNQSGIRKWVTRHIPMGKSPIAFADMDILYDKATNEKTLTRIDSNVYFANLRLNYDDYFPSVFGLNGEAEFRKDGMKIKIDNGKVLNSSIEGGEIKMDFGVGKNVLEILANVKGKPRDLFIHINNKERKSISKTVEKLLNGVALSEVQIQIPIIKNLKFKDIFLGLFTETRNNNTGYFRDNSNVKFTLLKNAGSSLVKGRVNLSGAKIYSPLLSIEKSKSKPTDIVFDLLVKDKEVDIVNVETRSSDIKFKANGKIKTNNSSSSIKVENIQYDNNKFDVYYNKIFIEDKETATLTLAGESFDLTKFFDSFRRKDGKKEKFSFKHDIENLIFKAQIDNVQLKNNKSLQGVAVDIRCAENICFNFDMSGNFADNSKTVTANLSAKNMKKPEKKKLKIKCDDFGYMVDGMGLTNKIIDGKGELKANVETTKNDDLIMKGTLSVPSKFTVMTQNTFSTKVMDILMREKLFPKLREFLVKDNMTFNKMKSDFKLENNFLEIRDTILSGSLLGIGITMSGYVDLGMGEVKIKGLVIPAENLNSLFGISKIPIAGSIIFGKKDSGLFASQFRYSKANYETEGEFKLNKASAVAPGVLRNLFNSKKFFN